MKTGERMAGNPVFFTILVWGSLWGIFEATVGYLLHLLPVSLSWLILYPAAGFFMAGVHRKTGRISSVVLVATLCASIKMLNLLLPGRIDKVINPAVSILFEGLAVAAVLFALHRLLGERLKSPPVKALAALSMNTGWRLLFIVYLFFLVPDWMQEVSVISAVGKFIPFFVTQNLLSSLLLYLGYQFKEVIFRPVKTIAQKIMAIGAYMSKGALPALKTGAVVLMLGANVVLELLL